MSEKKSKYEEFKERIAKETEEFNVDTSFDDFNLLDVQSKLTPNSHKWLVKCTLKKTKLLELMDLKVKLEEKLQQQIKEDSHVSLSDAAINRMIKKNEMMKNVNETIAITKLHIEFYDIVIKNCQNLSFNIKNFIAYRQLETS